MAKVNAINYFSDYQELRPSLFRESENLDSLIYSISEVQNKQQEDFLWLSENILNTDIAEKAHLDFIGNIVGQPRFLVDFNAETYFGFDGAYKSDTFGMSGAPYVGGYWNSRSYFNSATARVLSDDEYRRIIKARVIYNRSDCKSNDLLEVINLITNRNNNSVELVKHGLIKIKSSDTTGLLSYFVEKINSLENILPIAAGVRVLLEIEGEDYFGKEMTEFLNLLEKLVNVDLPSAIGDIK